MQLLRDRTAALHSRVERSIPILHLCQSLATYRRLLLRLVGFYSVAEIRLSPFKWDLLGLDFDARRKTPSLQDDLRCLEVQSDEIAAAIKAADAADAFPAVRTFEQALGALYVLEGATLGGKIISRTVAGSLGLTRDHGARFYDIYGERCGQYWKAFRAAADAWCGDDESQATEALGAATATFEAFEAWMASLSQASSGVAMSADGDRGT